MKDDRHYLFSENAQVSPVHKEIISIIETTNKLAIYNYISEY